MKEALEAIIKNLVDEKDSVVINEKTENEATIFEVKVVKTDMGKIIGREGKIAKAIRTIMKSLGAKEGKKVLVNFVD